MGLGNTQDTADDGYYNLDLYIVRNTIGDYFERKIADIFGYINSKSAKAGRRVLDLSTKDGFCAFECKGSRAGGVILGKQIHPVQGSLHWVKMFYVFAYHPLKCIRKNQETEKDLLKALDSSVKSYHILPNEIVSPYYLNNKPRQIQNRNEWQVPLSASKARKIYNKDPRVWARMGLSPDEFYMSSPHEKIFVTAQSPELLGTLLEHFDPRKIQSHEVLETMLKELADRKKKEELLTKGPEDFCASLESFC
jgi:hypothetical protein